MGSFSHSSSTLLSEYLSFSVFFLVSHCQIICRLRHSHTGKYLAEEMIKVLKTFGIEKKVCWDLIFAKSV